MKFCRRHRSYFCPDVRPSAYHDVDAALAAWDAAEEKYQEQKRSHDTPAN